MNNKIFNDFRKFATNQKFNGQYITGDFLDDYKKHGISDYITPYVIEHSRDNGVSIDIFSRLIRDNIIFLGDEIDDNLANVISAQLLFLSNENSESDISLYCNSPGGSVYAGMEIVATMHYVPNTIKTVCLGLCASMASVILACGDYGCRFIQNNGTVMIHQPITGVQGPAADIQIVSDEVNRLKKELFNILADRTGHTYDDICTIAQRDNWMSAQDALAFNIVDGILPTHQPKTVKYVDWKKEQNDK